MDLAGLIKRGEELAETPENGDAIAAWGRKADSYMKNEHNDEGAITSRLYGGVVMFSDGSPESRAQVIAERRQNLLNAIAYLKEMLLYSPSPPPPPEPKAPVFANYNIVNITIGQLLQILEKHIESEPEPKRNKLRIAFKEIRGSLERIASQTLADVIKSKIP